MDALDRIRSAGLTLRIKDGHLHVRPKQLLTSELRMLIANNKRGLIIRISSEPASTNGLVQELMEEDGLTLAEAQAVAVGAPTPRSPAQWLALIAELDALIERYCEIFNYSADKRSEILVTRGKQSLASIPSTLAWFRQALAENDNEDGTRQRDRAGDG